MKKTKEFEKVNNNVEYDRKSPLRRLILLVAFTGILLITSTYAWFTTQNSVKISGIRGSVGAVEGLEVSLDGENWTNNLALTAGNLEAAPGYNVIPEYLDPVSTTGTATDRVEATAGDATQGIAAQQAEVQFYKGLYNAKTDALTEIGATTEGYYAIDLYVKNTSSEESDILKLTNDSSIVIDSNKESTGLQNTTRLGLALYEEKIEDTLATKATVTGTDWGNVKDVTIWEPNANAHVAEVLETNNKVTVNYTIGENTYNTTPNNLLGDSQIPTYALSKASITAGNISNIYTWTTEGIANTGLQKQVTLQTTKEGIGNKAIELPSVDGTNKFALAGKGIYKLRVYLWLEGQDVDTINHASHGGSVTLNLGLTKGEAKVAISKIALDKEEAELKVGESTTLTATVNADAEEELQWESSNEEVAIIEKIETAKMGTIASSSNLESILLATTSEGKEIAVTIKALTAGTTTITGKNVDGTISSKCEVIVKQTITEITLDHETADVTKGDNITIKATIDEGAEDNVVWSSSNSSVATVTGSGTNNTTGTITGTGKGTATIYAKNSSGKIVDSCIVTVHQYITSITLDKETEIEVANGESLIITAIINEGAEDDVVWTSSNPEVATVTRSGTNSTTGTVTTLSAGTTTITARNNKGDVTQSSTVTVYNMISFSVRGVPCSAKEGSSWGSWCRGESFAWGVRPDGVVCIEDSHVFRDVWLFCQFDYNIRGFSLRR